MKVCIRVAAIRRQAKRLAAIAAERAASALLGDELVAVLAARAAVLRS